MTYEERLNVMLSKVPNTIDKRKGSFIYLALAPVAYILSLTSKNDEDIYNETYADTATGNNLTKRCAERGVFRKEATFAIRKGTFNIAVPVGSRFGIDNLTFTVIEQLQNNNAKLRCEQSGTIGNDSLGDMLPITYVQGLITSELTDILIPGEDAEDDESLRERYYESLQSEAFGGNQADYKKKMKSLQGVGGVKVYPVWNGGGTVKLVFIDSTYSKPSNELINTIQTSIDPIQNSGNGIGLAPIGHCVTVTGVDNLTVNVSSNISLASGYVWDDVINNISAAIEAYLLELRKSWDSENNIIVRISQIESAVLRVTGVIDIQNTTLNLQNTNLILTDIQIPILGSVTKV